MSGSYYVIDTGNGNTVTTSTIESLEDEISLVMRGLTVKLGGSLKL